MIGRGELGKARGVRHPVEIAAIHQDAAHRRAMAAHEFGQRMHHDVGAMVDRACSRIGVATVLSTISGTPWACATVRDGLDVADIAGGIAHGLAEQRAGIFVHPGRHRFGAVARRQSARRCPDRGSTWCQQGMGGAVKLGRRDDIAAAIARHWRRHNTAPPGRTRWPARRRRLPAPRRAPPAPRPWDWRCGCSDSLLLPD